MAVTYRWAAEQMDAYPKLENHKDVVFSIHWRLYASDKENEVNVYGSQGLEVNAEGDLTPYDKLTEEQVLGWLKDAIGEEEIAGMEKQLAKQLEELANPPVVNPPLPWSK